MRMPNERGETGNYDDEAEEIVQKVSADTVVLMVLGGEKGNGFSVSSRSYGSGIPPATLRKLPLMLEDIAKQLREKLKGQEQS